MIFPSGLMNRWSFQKEPREDVIFLVLSGKMISFSWIHDIISFDRKPEMVFLKKYREIWYFLWIRTGVTNVFSRPSVKKKKKKSKMALSGKNTPTGGWPSRMTFRNSNVVNGGHVLQRKPKETIILNKYDLKWKETLEKCKWEHRTR